MRKEEDSRCNQKRKAWACTTKKGLFCHFLAPSLTSQKLREKPLLNELVNCGIYTLSPDILSRVRKEFFPITELFEECLDNNEPIGGYIIEEDWADIGMPEELSNAQGKS